MHNMARPRKLRMVNFEPGVTYFKPRAVPLAHLEEIDITVDELEAMRLCDVESLSQEEAAGKMEIHQSTFQRTLARARKKAADALVNGKAIKIKGGDYKMPRGDGTGPMGAGPGRGFGRGSGRGRMGGPLAAGPGGDCVCPKCGHHMAHARGQPCNQTRCPKCSTMMTRA